MRNVFFFFFFYPVWKVAKITQRLRQAEEVVVDYRRQIEVGSLQVYTYR